MFVLVIKSLQRSVLPKNSSAPESASVMILPVIGITFYSHWGETVVFIIQAGL